MDRQMMGVPSSARRTIASFSSYADAQRAVDQLADQRFPVERTAIVAEGLKIVEQVTGRLNYGRALTNGLASGLTSGLFIGLIVGFLSGALLNGILLGIVIGAIVGGVFSLIAYALSGGRRDFTSVNGIQADRYNVMVDLEVADEAQRLLQAAPTV